MRDEHLFIAELLEKYPDLNQEEREQFNQWLEQGNNRYFFEQILEKEILEEELRQLDELKIESEQRQSWEKLIQVRQQKGRVFQWNNWKMYAAAASIIMILGLGSLIWYQSKKEDKPVVQTNESHAPIVTDVNPGQYKARLTLADGSVVVLDSFSNNKLVQQGSTTVLTRDGQLVYEQKGKHTEILYNTLTTAKGETYGMVLSDGSKVWLNSQSSLRYPVAFTDDERRVEITGEAYFEVAKNPKQPFIAQVKGMEVKVLGTIFNVNAYDEENKITTTLLEGKVQLTKEDKTEILTPGQQAELLPSGSLHVNKDADLHKAVGWKEGLFVFKGDGVEYMMNQLARWYDVNVVYKGVIKDKFTGIINRNLPVSVVLDMLERSTVHFQIKGRTIIVTP